MGIVNFFKRVIGIYNIKTVMDTLGIKSAVSDVMRGNIQKWSNLYSGCAKATDKKSLNLPAAIASELARLVTIEFKSKIAGSSRANYLNTAYAEVIEDIRNITEYACAKGGIILKPYLSGGEIHINYVQADNFVPTEFDMSGNIAGMAFFDCRHRSDKIYTRIEHHYYKGSTYIIENFAFSSRLESDIGRRIPLTEVEEWKDIQPKVQITGVKKPLFAYFKMPMANTVDTGSPLGVSVYSRAVELMHDADTQYERLLWEFESGERALYVDKNAYQKGEDGKCIFPDKRLYKAIDSINENGLFKEWTPPIREQNIIKGLNEILRKVEFNTGLAYGTLSDVQDTDKTAEEIKASKQRSYANVADIQQSLKFALLDLVDALNAICDLYELHKPGDTNVSFDFDDSIIADRKTEFAEKTQLLATGIMQPWEMRAWYFGEDEETAKKNVADEEPPGAEE